MRIPDYFEAIVGYRVWRVLPGGLLTGVHVCEPWAPKEPHRATCQIQFGQSFEGANNGAHHLVNGEYVSAPASHCTCGLWAAKTVDGLAMKAGLDQHPAGPGFAWGAVYLWGRVIEHEDGWRAEYAYPKALTATSDAEALSARYGVPCETRTAAPSYITVENPTAFASTCLRAFMDHQHTRTVFARHLCRDVSPADLLMKSVVICLPCDATTIPLAMQVLVEECERDEIVEYGEGEIASAPLWARATKEGQRGASVAVAFDMARAAYVVSVVGCRAGVEKHPPVASIAPIQIAPIQSVSIPMAFMPYLPVESPKVGISIRFIKEFFMKQGGR